MPSTDHALPPDAKELRRISRREEMRKHCQEFHNNNPEVWDLFVKFTMDRIGAGFKHFGARCIWEKIRWETPMGEDGETKFKVNDHYHTFYGRRFMGMYPEHKGFFRLRVQTSAYDPPRDEPEYGPADVP